jgi:hypothetical protein
MTSKLEIFLWLISLSLPSIPLIMLFTIFPNFRKKIIKWLVKKFLDEKERKGLSIDKSIRNSKISNNSGASIKEEIGGSKLVVKFEDVEGNVSFNQWNYRIDSYKSSQKKKKEKEKNNEKLKISEKSMSSIVEKRIQKSKEKTKMLEEILKELKDEANKEED